MREWPVPRCLRDVRSFVWICSYYGKFLGGFAHIAAPLHALTKKNRPFVWDVACQHAFDDSKETLTSAPVLGLPLDDGLFVLDTVAISVGLSQVQD